MAACSNCGARNPPDFAYCGTCAQSLSSQEAAASRDEVRVKADPTCADAGPVDLKADSTFANAGQVGLKADSAFAHGGQARPNAGRAFVDAVQSGPITATADPAFPVVRIDVDRSKEFRVGSSCYLDFRVSGTGLWRRMHVAVQIVAGIAERDEEHQFELTLDEQEPSATHSWRFIPSLPGEQQIRSLRVAVQNLEDVSRTTFVRMRREAMSFHVSPQWSSEGSQITIQGSVYGSLIGHRPQTPASAYADDLVRWANLPLVADRDGSWWQDRRIDLARTSGGAVIRWRANDGPRALFVVPGEVARLGRRKEDCEIVTRWLPCRSPEEDGERWERTQSISRAHLRVTIRPDGAAIEPEEGASSATHLELDGGWRRLTTDRWPITRETRVRLGAPGGSPQAGLLLTIMPVVHQRRVVAALITRPENAPEHAYLLLAAACPIRRCGVSAKEIPETIEIAPTTNGVAVRALASQRVDAAALEIASLSPDDFTRYPS